MKFWIFIGNGIINTIRNRNIPSNALCRTCRLSIYISRTYNERCKLWMNIKIFTCKWSSIFFYMCIYAYGSRIILWIIHISKRRSMKCRSNNIFNNDINSICRICITMRTNVIMSSNSNNKFSISSTICRSRYSRMIMRRI